MPKESENKGLPLSSPESGFTRRALDRGGVDPRALLRWGQMMAVALLEVVKAVEEKYGAEGQSLCIESMEEVGRRVGGELLKSVEAPAGLTDIERISLLASWVNRNIYASPEYPQVLSEDECCFDILWCPHQDIYTARDCRIQRYLVQGMLDAFRDSGLMESDFDLEVQSLIPLGAETCHFRIWRKLDKGPRAWSRHSAYLAGRETEGS